MRYLFLMLRILMAIIFIAISIAYFAIIYKESKIGNEGCPSMKIELVELNNENISDIFSHSSSL